MIVLSMLFIMGVIYLGAVIQLLTGRTWTD